MRFRIVALVVGLLAGLAQSAHAEHKLCGGETLYVQRESESRTRLEAEPSDVHKVLYAATLVEAAKAYAGCASNLAAAKREAWEGAAKYEAATRYFAAARILHDLGLTYKPDLENAWYYATESASELKSGKQRDDAKVLLREIEHLQAHE